MQKMLVFGLACLLTGCASSGREGYRPVAGSENVPITATHQVSGDRFYVQLATQGYRVESASLVMPNGALLAPTQVHHPPKPVNRQTSGGGASVGVGVLGRSGGVGVGVGIPVGGGNVHGNTIVYFRRDSVGEGPWLLRVKLLGFPGVDIELPILTEQPEE